MARWLVGTSGYVYRDWRRRFYPQGLGARDWLPYYAATFETVELNSPFYRLPRAATFRAWAAAGDAAACLERPHAARRCARVRNSSVSRRALRTAAARPSLLK